MYVYLKKSNQLVVKSWKSNLIILEKEKKIQIHLLIKINYKRPQIFILYNAKLYLASADFSRKELRVRWSNLKTTCSSDKVIISIDQEIIQIYKMQSSYRVNKRFTEEQSGFVSMKQFQCTEYSICNSEKSFWHPYLVFFGK